MAHVSDRYYYKIEDIEACEKAGITAYLPKLIRGSAVREGFFTKDEFRYDPDQEIIVCPAGQTDRRLRQSARADRATM